jgi:hypothetical protein
MAMPRDKAGNKAKGKFSRNITGWKEFHLASNLQRIRRPSEVIRREHHQETHIVPGARPTRL